MKKLFCLFVYFISYSSWSSDSYIQTIEKILENDPEYIEVQNQKAYQETIYKESISELILPSINLNLSKVDTKQELGDNSFNSELGGLNFSLSLFKFGSDYARYNASRLALNSFNSQLKVNLINRERNIIGKLLEYTSQNEILKIQKETLNIKKKFFNISQSRYKKGGISRDDLRSVEIDYLNTNSELIITKQAILEIKNDLVAYGEVNFSILSKYPWTSKFTNTMVSKILSHEVNIETTPNIKRLEMLLRSKKQQVANVKRSHFGQVTFDYSRTYNNNEDSDSRFGSRASLNFTIPLFEKYSRQKQLALARSEVSTTDAYYRFEIKRQKSLSSNLKERFKLSDENLRLRRKTLLGAKRLFRNSTKQFKRGLLSANDLLIEQDRYLATKLLTNRAILSMHLDYMNLIHFYGLAITDKPKF